jgi:bifunctional DNA-binding transcriptional regulator/antitoxin component of YhaV-PrlF toxin-antitoxin module
VFNEAILDKTRLGRFCRTTVPESMRKFFSIGLEDFIYWIFNNGKIYVRKASNGGLVDG